MILDFLADILDTQNSKTKLWNKGQLIKESEYCYTSSVKEEPYSYQKT